MFREILGKIHQDFAEKWQNFENLVKIFEKMPKIFNKFLLKIWDLSGAKEMQIL